ncbi:FHA domain-containing protein [Tessaracoccus palaemonis]|uniref:FHA domain-containing protein n=1 Tax=Tessaracoccus palaemonis TaxID=2829499 RepID=A0ABX8SPR6_9ACTN|nr:FHA domain-containing protein [Tessaracoccus palaemonis]QXT63209.1 FHA domain-containing protein [Tessaracoccus palaemonis]
MALPEAAWRVTYTPGNWLVLSGPTTLVVMLPAPARASGLVADLWTAILSAGSVEALLNLVHEVGLDAMPHLGAFFWEGGTLHGLTRGDVRVLDADTGDVALEGSGSITWREEDLGAERRLRIDLEPVAGDEVLHLPLVVGAVCVSSLELSTVDRVVFPVAGGEPLAPVVAAVPAPEQPVEDAPTPAFVPEPEVVDSAADLTDLDLGAPDPAAAIAGVPIPAPAVVPPAPAPVAAEAEGGTIFSTGLAATHKPPTADADGQVLAVPCANGHPNAPGTRTCRLCQAPVDSSNPRVIRRPVLAGVHTNGGDFADIVAGVVIGRAPDAAHGPAGSGLLRVQSPSSDISRNHLLVTTRDWNVHVTDLNSTNGTMVLPVGEAPFALRDGASVQVEIGTVLDLGDGVSVRIEPPRG